MAAMVPLVPTVSLDQRAVPPKYNTRFPSPCSASEKRPSQDAIDAPRAMLRGALSSPHTMGHAPQSPTQLVQVSPGLQVPSPQRGGHAPQSPAQLVQVSPGLHVPSPQRAGHAPQSPAQLVQVSVAALHVPSPQRGGHAPQSTGQTIQLSPALHVRSPQPGGHAPQSLAQLLHVSAALHVPSPQPGPGPASVPTGPPSPSLGAPESMSVPESPGSRIVGGGALFCAHDASAEATAITQRAIGRRDIRNTA